MARRDPTELPEVLRAVAVGPLPTGFMRREVQIGPGESLAYVETAWHEALIVVAEGTVEVRCRAGGRRCFAAGDTIWFDGLEVATLGNPGTVPLRLLSVRRLERPPV